MGVDSVTPSIYDRKKRNELIEQSLDFILGHFEEPFFPRTISTHTTEGGQILLFNKDEALARFEQANYLDCRINPYPDYTGFHGVNRQAPNFVLIDLDRAIFKTERQFQLAVTRTMENIKRLLDGIPTIIWTGNGVHIYQPLQAFLLESESLFAKFDQPSQSFLKFAEKHLSDNRSCPAHNPAFRSCMLRIPGSLNFKCIQQNNGAARFQLSTLRATLITLLVLTLAAALNYFTFQCNACMYGLTLSLILLLTLCGCLPSRIVAIPHRSIPIGPTKHFQTRVLDAPSDK